MLETGWVKGTVALSDMSQVLPCPWLGVWMLDAKRRWGTGDGAENEVIGLCTVAEFFWNDQRQGLLTYSLRRLDC